MKRKYLLLLALLVLSLNLVSAKDPIKFGKVNLEDLQMTQYDGDTSAVAVVLCKYGEFNAAEFKFTLTQRVKILKKAGTAYSEFSFPSRESVTVRGRVFNLVNGEIEEEKVKKENIFKEKVTDSYYRNNIAIPNVKVGTVYDIQYTFEGFPFEFGFQQYIPVKHSELRIEESQYVRFRKRNVGFIYPTSPKNNVFVCKNVPAFKKEAFISSSKNYIAKFEFDILEISYPGYYKSYSTSWESINDRLNDNTYFGDAIHNGSMYLNDIKKEILAKYNSPEEQIKAAVEAIKTVQWDHSYSIYANTPSLSGAYKDGKANAAEINLMLLQLLNKLDIECKPVVLSTRSNGLLNPYYPSQGKLNYVIVCAMVNEKEILLDATEKYMPAGMLPYRCLNDQGRLVNKTNGRWIDLKTNKKDHKIIMYKLTLDDNLNLNGEIEYARTDYAAYNFRDDYHEFASEEEYITDLESRFSGLTIKDYSIDNIEDLTKPIKDRYQISISNKVEKVGDMILINPFLFEQVDDNPFKMEKREYPVDFGYKREKFMISKIEIPDNYQITEIPKPIRAVLPDKSTSVLINYQTLGNSITVTYRLKIGKQLYLMDEYAYLQQLYKAIIEKHAEPIIIKPVQNEASL